VKSLLIVYHSVTGGTLQMAEAAATAARREAGVTVRLEAAAAAGPQALLECDGYLFACPENLAAMSGVMKDFFDRTYYPVLDRLQGRAYAILVCAGSSSASPPAGGCATSRRLSSSVPTHKPPKKSCVRSR